MGSSSLSTVEESSVDDDERLHTLHTPPLTPRTKKGMADFCFPETSRRISESLSSTKDDAEDLDLDVEFDGELSEVEEEDEEEEQGDTSKSEGGKAEDSSQKS